MVSMNFAVRPPSPRAFRSSEMFCDRLLSSTKLSGHTFLINSSLPTICPPRSTSADSVSKSFGVSATSVSSRDSVPSAASSRKGPNSYEHGFGFSMILHVSSRSWTRPAFEDGCQDFIRLQLDFRQDIQGCLAYPPFRADLPTVQNYVR